MRAIACVALIFSSVLAACQATQDDQSKIVDANRVAGKFGSTTFELEEKAHDGQYLIDPDKISVVDANSDLVLTFNQITPDPPSEEWKQVNDLLALAVGFEAERSRLNAAVTKIDPLDAQSVKQIQASAAEVSGKVAQFLEAFRTRANLSKDAAQAIMTRERSDGEIDAYANLQSWLRDRLATLEAQATARLARAPKYQVKVEAWIDPVGDKRRQLHVENYDTLPAGEVHLIDRYGLRLTPPEAARLRMEMEQAELAVKTFKELEGFVNDYRRQLDDLVASLRDIEQRLVKILDQKGFASVLGELHRLEADATKSEDVRGAAKAILAAIDAIDHARSALRELRFLAGQATSPKLSELLFGDSGVVKQIGLMQTAFEELASAASGLPAKIALVVPEVAAALQADAKTILQDELRSLADDWRARLPNTVAFLQAIAKWFGQSRGLADLQDSKPGDLLSHPVEDAPPARVELTRSGITPGDAVTVQATFEDDPTHKTVYQQTYKTESRLTGVHREISAKFIFARGVTGTADAKRWKPNVAAVADWHYYARNPSGFEKVWNWLDPGLGVHLASLDQGDESVEFGLGGTVSLFGGFITGGYGWDLSVSDDREYYFIGIDLFDVLNSARKVEGGTR